ncbi:hypothetical protein [Streptomyces sp. T028]|uniref:hypothetical protein n=1 Tax=Streptomyces sp. T028 TaxID=3394379 RepID=UPI003A85FCD4
MLQEELESLVDRLAEMARPVVPWLVPGVEAGQVEAAVGPFPPDEVVSWFGWCNGVEFHDGQTQDEINVIPGYAPVSLREALGIRRSYGADPVLGEHWVPVLAGPSGDLYAAVWRPGQPARVAGVLIGESTNIEFASLEQMVRVFNECYRRGAFYVDDQQYLEMDADLCDEVYSAMTQ